MKNKRIFYLVSVTMFGLVYIFGFSLFLNFWTFEQIPILFKAILALAALPLLALIIIHSFSRKLYFSKELLSDKHNAIGVILSYFGYYLIIAFIVNFLIFFIFEQYTEMLLTINFILLTPFTILGFIKGLLVLKYTPQQ